MGKILFTSHLANFVKFNKVYMQWFRKRGWEVHYASLDEEDIPNCDKHFKVCFNRLPYSIDNLHAYSQLKKIIDSECYDIIHCHTPMGGVVTRLAAISARKRGTKVLYTAHGFHFYRGAPAVSWLLYYPIEKLLARVTDCLIVMNQEDYTLASVKKFKAGHIKKIDGVGVDLNRFNPVIGEEKERAKKELGLESENFTLLYIAEFIPRKNHEFLLECFADIKQKIPNIRLILAGCGQLFETCKSQCLDLGISESVLFLGYRRDVNRICQATDILVSVSRQEGLPVNILEGMASGLPVICTAIRGQIDIITPDENGILFRTGDTEAFCNAVHRFYEDNELRRSVGNGNLIDVRQYSVESAIERMAEIYGEYI